MPTNYSIKQGSPGAGEGSNGSVTIRWVSNSLHYFIKYNSRWYSTQLSDKAITLADELSITTVNMGAQVFTSMNTSKLYVTSIFDCSAVQPASFSIPLNSIAYNRLTSDANRITIEDNNESATVTLQGGGEAIKFVGTSNEVDIELDTSGKIFTLSLPSDIDITATLDVGTALDVGTTLDVGTAATIGTTLDVTGLITGSAGIVLDNFSVANTSGDTQIGGTLNVDGSLTVAGSATTINSTDLTIEDHQIELNYNSANPGSETDIQADDGGIILHKTGGTEASLLWDKDTTAWTSNQDLIVKSTLYVKDATKRLGINVASPTVALDIAGNANEGGILYTGVEGANSILVAGNANCGGIDFKTISNTVQPYNYFLFNDGFVGIGTNSPGVKLEISESTSADCVGRIVGGSGNHGILELWSNSGASADDGWRLISNNGGKLEIGESSAAMSSPSWNSRMVILEGGNVGIGVDDDSPDTKLEVMNSSVQLKLSHDATNYTTFGTDSSGYLNVYPSGLNVLYHDDIATIRNENYVSGIFAGSGWSLYKTGSDYDFEVDNLWVRGSMYVWELVINQIRATNGSIVVTSSAKCKDVSDQADTVVLEEDSTYTLIFETGDGDSIDYHPFADGDLILAHTTKIGDATDNPASVLEIRAHVVDHDIDTGNVNYCSVQIDSIPASTTVADIIGMAFVRVGSSSNATRRGGVYLTSDDSQSPFIDVWNEVDTFAAWDAASKTKMRIGKLDGITGELNDYGMFAGDKPLDNYVVAGSASGVRISSNAKQYIAATGSNIEFYDDISGTATKKMSIGAGSVKMFANDGVTVTGDWSNTTMTIGDVAQNNVYITANKLALRDATTELIVLNNDGTASIAGAVTIGGIALETTTADAASANQDSTASIQSGTTAADVGLGNVTNVSQSTIQSDTLSAASASDVGLGNVTNVSQSTIQSDTLSAASASDVGLDQVTNESKATMFTSPAITGTPTGISSSHVGLGNVSNITTDTMRATAAATTGTIGPITISADGGSGGGAALYQGAGNYGNPNTGFFMDSSGNFSLKDKLKFNGTTLEITGAGTFSGNLSGARGSFYGQITGYAAAATNEHVGLTLVNDQTGQNVICMSGADARIGMGGTHDGDGTFTHQTASKSSIIWMGSNGGTGQQAYIDFDSISSGDTMRATVGSDLDGFYMCYGGTLATDPFLLQWNDSFDLYLGRIGDGWVKSVNNGFQTSGVFQGELDGNVRGDLRPDGVLATSTYHLWPAQDSTYYIGTHSGRYAYVYTDNLRCTTDIPTTETAAKCTDANADQTSANYSKGVYIRDKDNDTTCYPLFADSSSTNSNRYLYSDSSLRWDSSGNILHCNLTGNVSGNATTATTATRASFYRTSYNAGGQRDGTISFALAYHISGSYYHEHYLCETGTTVTGSMFANMYHHYNKLIATHNGSVRSVMLRFRYGDIGTVHLEVWKHAVGTDYSANATEIQGATTMSENGQGNAQYYYKDMNSTSCTFDRGDCLYIVIYGIDLSIGSQIYEASVDLEYDGDN